MLSVISSRCLKSPPYMRGDLAIDQSAICKVNQREKSSLLYKKDIAHSKF